MQDELAFAPRFGSTKTPRFGDNRGRVTAALRNRAAGTQASLVEV